MLTRLLIVVSVLVAGGIIFILIARRTPSTVVVERTFAAPIKTVWEHWSRPDSIRKWWSPKGYTAPVVESDFVVGGKFLFAMESPSGVRHYNAGRYTEITPHSRIVSTLSFSDEKGNAIAGAEVPVPGVWPDSVLVEVDFSEVDGKTRVVVKEHGIPMLMKILAKMGWSQQFDKFEKLLADG